MSISSAGNKLDTSLAVWRHFYRERGLEIHTLPKPPLLGRGQGWLILTPNSLTTQDLADWADVRSSFQKLDDAFICEEVPPDILEKTASDLIFSSRIRPLDRQGWSGVRIRALDAARQDRNLRGFSADMAWKMVDGRWFITLKEYLALWLLAKSQGKIIDADTRTICAGSEILRHRGPICNREGQPDKYWLPAVGEDRGILRIERIHPNFRHADYASRRVFSLLRISDRGVRQESAPTPVFESRMRLSRLML